MSSFSKIFYFNLRRDHQKISYERRAYESVGEKSLSLAMSRTTTKKEFGRIKVEGNENLHICLTLIVLALPDGIVLAKFSISIEEGIIKKISYERRAYESVGEKSLSLAMSRTTTNKEFGRIRVNSHGRLQLLLTTTKWHVKLRMVNISHRFNTESQKATTRTTTWRLLQRSRLYDPQKSR